MLHVAESVTDLPRSEGLGGKEFWLKDTRFKDLIGLSKVAAYKGGAFFEGARHDIEQANNVFAIEEPTVDEE